MIFPEAPAFPTVAQVFEDVESIEGAGLGLFWGTGPNDMLPMVVAGDALRNCIGDERLNDLPGKF